MLKMLSSVFNGQLWTQCNGETWPKLPNKSNSCECDWGSLGCVISLSLMVMELMDSAWMPVKIGIHKRGVLRAVVISCLTDRSPHCEVACVGHGYKTCSAARNSLDWSWKIKTYTWDIIPVCKFWGNHSCMWKELYFCTVLVPKGGKCVQCLFQWQNKNVLSKAWKECWLVLELCTHTCLLKNMHEQFQHL